MGVKSNILVTYSLLSKDNIILHEIWSYSNHGLNFCYIPVSTRIYITYLYRFKSLI